MNAYLADAASTANSDGRGVRVLLADDHDVVRACLRGLIEACPGFEIAAECASGTELVRLATDILPDIVVTDLFMADLDGLDAIEQIARRQPQIRIVALSLHGEEEYISAAVFAGVCAYVLKNEAAEDMHPALLAAATGERFVSPALQAYLGDRLSLLWWARARLAEASGNHETTNPLDHSVALARPAVVDVGHDQGTPHAVLPYPPQLAQGSQGKGARS